MGIAIVKTHMQQGKSDAVGYEARRFDSEDDAKAMCCSQTHIEFLGYYPCTYELAQKEIDKINKLPPSEREEAESGLGEKLNQQP